MSLDGHERRWQTYLTAYGPVGREEREALLRGCVADDVVFTNPGGEGRTIEGLADHIASFQSTMPGARFETEKIYAHHDEFLAVWTLFKPDGSKVATGYNIVRPQADGRFGYLGGFF